MNIFLADDHQLFLEGIQSVLSSLLPNIIIKTANNGHAALETLSKQNFDVALIDLRLPSLDGFSLLSELANINCLTPVIMVTASEDPFDELKAIDLGAMGFVSKSASGQEIVDAIFRVLDGEIVQQDNSIFNFERPSKNGDWASQHHITTRQLQVLRLIRQGLSNQAIADTLFLSLATVKTHIIAIYQALGAQSRTEAIQKSQQLGLD